MDIVIGQVYKVVQTAFSDRHGRHVIITSKRREDCEGQEVYYAKFLDRGKEVAVLLISQLAIADDLKYIMLAFKGIENGKVT